jgi:hypothetical protein
MSTPNSVHISQTKLNRRKLGTCRRQHDRPVVFKRRRAHGEPLQAAFGHLLRVIFDERLNLGYENMTMQVHGQCAVRPAHDARRAAGACSISSRSKHAVTAVQKHSPASAFEMHDHCAV